MEENFSTANSRPVCQAWDEVRETSPTIVTLGNFDGLHIGHQKIFTQLRIRGEDLHLKPVVVTFDPHPRVFFSGAPVSLLTPLEEKRYKLKKLGLTDVHFIRFDEALSRLSPLDFFQKFLVGRLQAQAIVLGENHRFGRGAKGDASFLQAQLGEDSHKLTVVPPIERGGEVVCSTAIRRQLSLGQVQKAAEFLGGPYTYSGQVVEGSGRGRNLGFPTANLKILGENKLLVAFGVYGGFMWVQGEKIPAVCNIGVKPTFSDNTSGIEAHLLGFSGDLYGKTVHLELHQFLRPEEKFPTPEALKKQIETDIQRYMGTISANSW